MEQIAPGVHQVSKGVNAFVIDGDEGVILIDTGLPKRHGAILDGLNSLGRAPSDIRSIILTHGHADHAGGAAELKRNSGADVVVSEVDAPIVRGDRPAPPPPVMDFPILRSLVGLLPPAEATTVDHEVTEGPLAIASDLSVVPTPGHTSGHISLLLDRSGGVLFAGDSAMSTRSGGVQRGWMNRKSPTFDASLKAMSELEFDIACFGHAPAISKGASGAFRKFASSI